MPSRWSLGRLWSTGMATSSNVFVSWRMLLDIVLSRPSVGCKRKRSESSTAEEETATGTEASLEDTFTATEDTLNATEEDTFTATEEEAVTSPFHETSWGSSTASPR